MLGLAAAAAAAAAVAANAASAAAVAAAFSTREANLRTFAKGFLLMKQIV